MKTKMPAAFDSGTGKLFDPSGFGRISSRERNAIISRFEERVNVAFQQKPPTRDFVKNAIRRQNVSRCPVRLNRLSYDVILRHRDALADLFCEFPDDLIFISPYHVFVGYQPKDQVDRIDPVEVLTGDARWTDEWGTRWGHAAGGVGATPVDYPIRDWSQLDEYLFSQFPKANAPGRLDTAVPVLNRHKGQKYTVGCIQIALFERIHCLRGMENTFEDMHDNEKEILRLAEAIVEYLLDLIRRWAALGSDAIYMTDDWGTQTALMIAPDMWRRLFKPYYRTLFDEIHRGNMDVFFHSCGNVTQIVPDLIEIGLDVLDPIQPGPMNIRQLAKEFGGHLSFQGGIDDQHLLASGTPQEIKDTIRELIDILGRPWGRGLILSMANALPPEVPFDNLRAMFEACHHQA